MDYRPPASSRPHIVISKASRVSLGSPIAPVRQRSAPDSQRPSKAAKSAHSKRKQDAAVSDVPSTDYSLHLLALAEEYIGAAHGMGSLAGIAQRQADLARYYQLMSAGLGCMESVLKNFRLLPRTEAALRLTYASVLLDETRNYSQIGEVLDKGIGICHRSHYADLRYSMHHLRARVLFQTNPRAALKSLDQPISEADTFQHVAWVYALRFLRVSLAMRMPEPLSALQQLSAIAALAKSAGDHAIFVTAAALEAVICLRMGGPNNLSQAQRVLASARSLELQVSIQELGKIGALIEFVDMGCLLQSSNLQGVEEKLNTLHSRMDAHFEGNVADSPTFSVLLQRSSGGETTKCTGGIFHRRPDGRDELSFRWVDKSDLYCLAYYLSSLTLNLGGDGRKSHPYIREGLGQISLKSKVTNPHPEPIMISACEHASRLSLDFQKRLALALMLCSVNNWPQARKIQVSLRKRVDEPPFVGSENIKRLVTYLDGVIAQGTGALDEALQYYQADVLAMPTKDVQTGNPETDIALLALMNRTLIVRDAQHSHHRLVDGVVARLETHSAQHPNRTMRTAFSLIRAILNPHDSVVKLKADLSNLIATAKGLNNPQLLAVAFNLMCAWIFKDHQGEQPIKSAKAAAIVADRCNNVVWMATSRGQLLDLARRLGQAQNFTKDVEKLEQLQSSLPASLLQDIAAKLAEANKSGNTYYSLDADPMEE